MRDYELCRKMIEEDPVLKNDLDLIIGKFGESRGEKYIESMQRAFIFQKYKSRESLRLYIKILKTRIMKKSNKIKLFCGAVVILTVPIFGAIYFNVMDALSKSKPINQVMQDICVDIFMLLFGTFGLLAILFVSDSEK